MADPLFELIPSFQAAIAGAFGPEHAGVDPALRRSDRADFQANVALGMRGKVPGSPRDIAAAIVKQLSAEERIEKLEIAGPGYINITLRAEYLSRALAEAAENGLGVRRAAQPETVVIDYSSPNVAKEMHVGNLRSTIIGDALARVLEAVGHRVVRQNHLGDWGTPFGMLIEHLIDVGAETTDRAVADLQEFYQAARKKYDADPDFASRSRGRVVLLQGGDSATLALWRSLVDATLRYLATVYEMLGVTLSEKDVAGESFYNPMLADVVAELDKLGLAQESDGALCVFPPGFVGREDDPLPLIVRKQDGGYGYATTDLAAIRHRVKTLAASRIIYVVGAPQAQHFSMVFKVSEMAGWLVPPTRAEHVAFGSVLGKDGKMFKTRSGETVRLLHLLTEARDRARSVVAEKNPELEAAACEQIAKSVGIGSVKYADLSSDRVKDYVFDWDRMLSFDGNTAPYLQYAHARIRSILRRAEASVPAPPAIAINAVSERALALSLLRFPSAVAEVADTLQPHRLCTYLYELAAAFSTFYQTCPVLRADTEETRASRLALTDLTGRTLASGLGMLGIEAPERM